MCSLTPEVLPLAGSPGADAVLGPTSSKGPPGSALLALMPDSPAQPTANAAKGGRVAPTHAYASPPGWHLNFPALGSFLSISFIKVVAFNGLSLSTTPTPPSRSLLAGDWKYVILKKEKTLHLFTFVTLCPGDELGEGRWVEVKPYVAMWASMGLVPQRRPQDNGSSVLPTSHTQHLGLINTTKSLPLAII